MSIAARPPVRLRRTPEAVREAALAEARRLLLEAGPEAVTLKAIARALGMSHANLIHHFGSAGGLQSALLEAMVRDLTTALSSQVEKVRAGELSSRAFVDVVFDAFDEGGAGRLAAWIALSHDERLFEPVRGALSAMAEALRQDGKPFEDSARDILLVGLLALGDSLAGSMMRGVLNLSNDAAREMAARLITPKP
ncbi:MAG: TetR/AcrR family transcriptional regulator [Caulobacteraceae bacterium]